MAGYLVMKEMDLIELHQLLSLYRRTYLEKDETMVTELLEEVGRKYRFVSCGKDIREARKGHKRSKESKRGWTKTGLHIRTGCQDPGDQGIWKKHTGNSQGSRLLHWTRSGRPEEKTVQEVKGVWKSIKIHPLILT